MDLFFWLLIILFVLIVILLVSFFFLGIFKPQPPAVGEYIKQEYLLSAAEHEFFQVLVKSIRSDQYVFAKVRIGDLIRVNGLVTESKDWWKKFGPIAKKHVDFVVCTRSPVRPIVAFELDDSSHQSAKARVRDTLVDSVMQSAGLPLVHIPYSSHGYSVQQIKAHVTNALKDRRSPEKTGQKALSQNAS